MVFPVSMSVNPVAYAGVAFAAYIAICHTLRFRSINKLQRKYGFAPVGSRPLSDMTDVEAQEILSSIGDYEFPALFEKGLQLALFRTYGIPTIAKLLVQTAQLSTNENIGKRYADTTILIGEIYGNPPLSDKGHEAFARLNYLHGHYIKQNRISNDDLLYTLALFMAHPCEWINRYEWRTLTDVEVCAIGSFHKSMGDAMNISFDVLPGSKTGWEDGLHFFRELDTWCKDYEKDNLVPDRANYLTALKTQDLLLSTLPSFTHSLVKQFLAAAMDAPLRRAIEFRPAHPIMRPIFESIMTVRKHLLRHLALPRPSFWPSSQLSDEETPDGRRWIVNFATTPHYIRPTWWNRWGPSGWYQIMLGAPRPGDKGMFPEGYRRANVGPRAFDGKGADFMATERARLRTTRTGGCPFIAVK